jgi:Flp pilus assembly protein TadD
MLKMYSTNGLHENDTTSRKIMAKGKKKAESPPQSQLNSLLEHYRNGRYDDAETLAISITEKFPHHQFSWKALGAVLRQTGRISESFVASQKAVEIDPKDADAHNNLGNTLRNLGKLEEAEASCRQAIALNPGYAGAHYNLGITLQELGRLEEAEASPNYSRRGSQSDGERRLNG